MLNTKYHATIISSASHVRRDQAVFDIASWQTGLCGVIFDSVSVADRPLSTLIIPKNKELVGKYRDGLRVYGLWRYRSYPLQQR